MSIQKILEMQNEWWYKITEAAKNIDPKLLGILTYQDLFDDKYCDDSFLHNYNAYVKPLVMDYKAAIITASQNYLLNFINDMSIIFQNTGYDINTGEETHDFDKFTNIPAGYKPSLEIEPVWDAVHNLKYEYTFKPFWECCNYVLYGNGESVNISAYSTPVEFIVKNRAHFKRSFGETNLQKMERMAQIRVSKLDYDVYIPALSKREDDSITGKYEEAIRRHLILKEFMENDELKHSDSLLYSTDIDKKGNINLTDLGYY